MSDLLPWLFIITAVIAMLGALFSLWLSLTLTLLLWCGIGYLALVVSKKPQVVKPVYPTQDDCDKEEQKEKNL